MGDKYTLQKENPSTAKILFCYKEKFNNKDFYDGNYNQIDFK